MRGRHPHIFARQGGQIVADALRKLLKRYACYQCGATVTEGEEYCAKCKRTLSSDIAEDR
jgi:predicted amidophosphoribosyltransferase